MRNQRSKCLLKFIVENEVALNIDSMESAQYTNNGSDNKWWATQGIKKIGNYTLTPTFTTVCQFESLNVEYTLLTISSDEGTNHHLCKVHIQNWKDFQASSIDDLLGLIVWLDQNQLLDKVTFHNCKAGRGRSSTFFILIELYKLAQKKNQTIYPLDAIKSVLRVKFTRHLEAVQTTDQLEMIMESVGKINELNNSSTC